MIVRYQEALYGFARHGCSPEHFGRDADRRRLLRTFTASTLGVSVFLLHENQARVAALIPATYYWTGELEKVVTGMQQFRHHKITNALPQRRVSIALYDEALL